jgi:hypothetical protein
MKKTTLLPLSFLFVILLSLSSASAVIIAPGGSGSPDIFTGIPGGTLLASINSGPIVSSNGKITFTLVGAVYSDPSNTFGANDLDFVYQVQNSANSVDGVARTTAIDFTGFMTDVGFITSGSSLPGALFTDGAVAPVTVDRSLSGDTVGFSFNPPVGAEIQPGQTSNVLIIQTNATLFAAGKFNVIDGGVSTVDAFQPTAIPESSTTILMGLGMIGLFAAYRVLGCRSVS